MLNYYRNLASALMAHQVVDLHHMEWNNPKHADYAAVANGKYISIFPINQAKVYRNIRKEKVSSDTKVWKLVL